MSIDWDELKELIDQVPDGLDRDQKKEPIPPKIKDSVRKRDGGICIVCSREYEYGSSNPYLRSQWDKITLKHSHLHHIIPNGDASPDNLITLCGYCHQTVHLLLFIMGKWKFARPV